MIILGIDPGYAIVGFGAVRYEKNRFTTIGYGAITTRAHTEFTSRLEEIYDGMGELIEKYRPDCISVGKALFQYQYHNGHCRGRSERLHTFFGKKESRTDLRIHTSSGKIVGNGIRKSRKGSRSWR